MYVHRAFQTFRICTPDLVEKLCARVNFTGRRKEGVKKQEFFFCGFYRLTVDSEVLFKIIENGISDLYFLCRNFAVSSQQSSDPQFQFFKIDRFYEIIVRAAAFLYLTSPITTTPTYASVLGIISTPMMGRTSAKRTTGI